MPMKLKYCLVFALAVVVLSGTSALADTLFSVNYKAGATPGTWVYTLWNNDPSGLANVTGMDLYWDEPVDPSYYSIVNTPDGWEEFPGVADCPAWDAIQNNPEPGDNLSGFVVQSALPAAYYTVYYVYYDQMDESGQVVPEPSSMLALLGGAAALGAMIRRRRA